MKHGIYSQASGAASEERRTVGHNGAQPKRAARCPTERSGAFFANARTARSLWGSVSKVALKNLRELTRKYGLSVMAGDLLMLEGRWYVTHSGLLSLGHRRRCSAIHAILQKDLCDPTLGRWVFKAVVYKTPRSKGFIGYGDADPSNVSIRVHGSEMRIAETRAVNRALRKAYGIGLCSVEELGSFSRNSGPASDDAPSTRRSTNGSGNGQPRLRDQLCLLIRQHNLDPTLVKAYAADFCGTPSLKEANRDLVQSFISHLTACAKENRDMLVCRLNSYAQPLTEVKQ
jgi:hypothetical protein